MIVNMLSVRMRSHNKCVIAFCEAHCSFIANGICLFRSNFPRLKTLSYLVSKNISLYLSPGYPEVFLFGKSKFFCNSFWIAFIGSDILAVLSFIIILCIINSVGNTIEDRQSFVLMHCDKFCRGHNLLHLPPKNSKKIGSYHF